MKKPYKDAGRDAPTSRPAWLDNHSGASTYRIHQFPRKGKHQGLTHISRAIAATCCDLAQRVAAHGDGERAQAFLRLASGIAARAVRL